MRVRLLLADDPTLLPGARSSLEQAGHDVEIVQSGAEAAARAVSPPKVHALVLPAMAPRDGVGAARQLRSQGRSDIAVILVLAPGDAGQRDACFAAGADDVMFGPATAAEILARLEARGGEMPFGSAPRVTAQIAIKLLAPNGALVPVEVSQISREAMLIAFPAGMATPAPGMMLRAAVPLPNGPLAVWVRAAAAMDLPWCALRFVGLTPAEAKLLDAYVATQLEPASIPVTAAALARPMGGSAAVAAAAIPAPTGGEERDERPGTDDSLRIVVEADLNVLATLAGKISSAKKDIEVPKGFSLTRMRAAVNRLAPTETSALRGTTMYNEIVSDLRESAGAKLMMYELTQQLKTGGTSLDRRLAQQVVQAATTLAEAIHDRLQVKLEEKIKAGDPKALRDLNPVKTGLLNGCADLRTALDRDVMGNAPPAPIAASFAAPSMARYDKPVTSGRTQNPDFKPVPIVEDAPKARTKTLVVVLVVFVSLAVWVNRGLFVTIPPPEFVAPSVAFTSGPLRVWMSTPGPDGWRFIVDDSWKKLTIDERAVALEDLARRAAAEKAATAIVLDPEGNVLATTPATASAIAPSPAP